jgi:predicted enzyme related to lactoylglutathione lyase
MRRNRSAHGNLRVRVDDVDGLLAHLRANGVQVLDQREETENGVFAYCMDPDGTLLELWQPAPGN